MVDKAVRMMVQRLYLLCGVSSRAGEFIGVSNVELCQFEEVSWASGSDFSRTSPFPSGLPAREHRAHVGFRH